MGDKQSVNFAFCGSDSIDIDVILSQYPGGQNAVTLGAPMATRPQVVRVLTRPVTTTSQPTATNDWCYDYMVVIC